MGQRGCGGGHPKVPDAGCSTPGMGTLPGRCCVSPPSCPSPPGPGAILTAGEGDAGQGLCAEHGSRHHHPAEQAKGGGHGGGRQGCAPRGSHHHPCGEGEGEGTRCWAAVSLHPAETRQGKQHPAQGWGMGGPQRTWPPQYGHELPTAPPAQSEMSPRPAGLLHQNLWHCQRCPLALLCSCTGPPGTVRDVSSPSGAPAPGTPAQRCLDAPAFAPRAHPHQGFLSLAPSVTRVSTKWGGTHTGTPFLQPFLQLMPEALGERATSQEPHGPQDPLLMATASPASGITSLAGEDRAAHLQPWSTGTRQAPEPWGLWPRAPRGPMPCTRLKRGRAASPARAGLAAARPSPAQPCVAPPGLREPESPAGRGRASAGWGSGCLRPPPLPRTPAGTAAKPGGGSWDGNQGALLLQLDAQGVTWGRKVCSDAWVCLLGKSLG